MFGDFMTKVTLKLHFSSVQSVFGHESGKRRDGAEIAFETFLNPFRILTFSRWCMTIFSTMQESVGADSKTLDINPARKTHFLAFFRTLVYRRIYAKVMRNRKKYKHTAKALSNQPIK